MKFIETRTRKNLNKAFVATSKIIAVIDNSSGSDIHLEGDTIIESSDSSRRIMGKIEEAER